MRTSWTSTFPSTSGVSGWSPRLTGRPRSIGNYLRDLHADGQNQWRAKHRVCRVCLFQTNSSTAEVTKKPLGRQEYSHGSPLGAFCGELWRFPAAGWPGKPERLEKRVSEGQIPRILRGCWIWAPAEPSIFRAMARFADRRNLKDAWIRLTQGFPDPLSF